MEEKDPATILNTYRLYRKDITESQNWIVPSNAVGNMFKVYVCGGGGYYCPAGGISEDYRLRYAGGGIGIWDGDTIIASFGSGGYGYNSEHFKPSEGGICIIQYYT